MTIITKTEQQKASIAAVLIMAEKNLCQGSKERVQDLMTEMAANMNIEADDIEFYCRVNENGGAV